MIDDFFDKEFWVVDFLPKQVPENAGGRFFSVEQYYLEPSRYVVMRERFSDILLKLYCYYDLRLLSTTIRKALPIPNLNCLQAISKTTKVICVSSSGHPKALSR